MKNNLKLQTLKFQEINPKTYEGGIPSGFGLVVAEKDNIVESALDLYGFDEIGLFDAEFKQPIYGFLKV
jgi:hypothetical protein